VYGGPGGQSFIASAQETTKFTGGPGPLDKASKSDIIKYTVDVNLTGTYISIMGGILSCLTNKSLIDTIMEMLIIKSTKDGVTVDSSQSDIINSLKVNDYIKLSAETNVSVNGIYQIISIGSAKEPWVLKKI
jgi:hypothetical protein